MHFVKFVIFFDQYNRLTEKIIHSIVYNSKKLGLYKTYRCLCVLIQVVQLKTLISLKMKSLSTYGEWRTLPHDDKQLFVVGIDWYEIWTVVFVVSVKRCDMPYSRSSAAEIFHKMVMSIGCQDHTIWRC